MGALCPTGMDAGYRSCMDDIDTIDYQYRHGAKLNCKSDDFDAKQIQDLKAIFRRIDTDNNGTIDKVEAKEAIRKAVGHYNRIFSYSSTHTHRPILCDIP